MIESFEVDKIRLYGEMFKEYYYIKLIENGITNYTREEYEMDFKDAICFYPFFVAIWFGSMSEEDLIDKNFPFFFIQRYFNFVDKFIF
jgi:hypothetical protein